MNRFDLSAIGGNGDVGNRSVFRFPGAMGGHGSVSVAVSHFDGIQCFGQGTDLVYFN